MSLCFLNRKHVHFRYTQLTRVPTRPLHRFSSCYFWPSSVSTAPLPLPIRPSPPAEPSPAPSPHSFPKRTSSFFSYIYSPSPPFPTMSCQAAFYVVHAVARAATWKITTAGTMTCCCASAFSGNTDTGGVWVGCWDTLRPA